MAFSIQVIDSIERTGSPGIKATSTFILTSPDSRRKEYMRSVCSHFGVQTFLLSQSVSPDYENTGQSPEHRRENRDLFLIFRRRFIA